MFGGGLSLRGVRRCPTLPHSLPCSTIGAEGLNFRVRDGTGCFPFAITAETSVTQPAPAFTRGKPRDGGVVGSLFRPDRPVFSFHSPQRLFVVWELHRDANIGSSRSSVWIGVQAARLISTGRLHTLRCFHLRPINPVVYREPYTHEGVGDLIWRKASRLDAFSGYPDRT